MEPNELKKVLDEREALRKTRESERAIFVVFVIIPGIAIAVSLLIRFSNL